MFRSCATRITEIVVSNASGWLVAKNAAKVEISLQFELYL